MTAPRFVKLPEAERERIATALLDRHRLQMRPGEVFEIGGTVSHGEVYLEMELRDPEETDVLRLEGRVDLESNEIQDPADAKNALLDFLDEVFIEFFEQDRELRVDLTWKLYTYHGVDLEVRGERRNRKLDRMADEWLAQHGEGGEEP